MLDVAPTFSGTLTPWDPSVTRGEITENHFLDVRQETPDKKTPTLVHAGMVAMNLAGIIASLSAPPPPDMYILGRNQLPLNLNKPHPNVETHIPKPLNHPDVNIQLSDHTHTQSGLTPDLNFLAVLAEEKENTFGEDGIPVPGSIILYEKTHTGSAVNEVDAALTQLQADGVLVTEIQTGNTSGLRLFTTTPGDEDTVIDALGTRPNVVVEQSVAFDVGLPSSQPLPETDGARELPENPTGIDIMPTLPTNPAWPARAMQLDLARDIMDRESPPENIAKGVTIRVIFADTGSAPDTSGVVLGRPLAPCISLVNGVDHDTCVDGYGHGHIVLTALFNPCEDTPPDTACERGPLAEMPSVGFGSIVWITESGHSTTALLAATLEQVIQYSDDHPTEVIVVNFSGGLHSSSETIDYLLKALYEKGVLVIAATGNNDDATRTPATSATNGHALSVGATNRHGEIPDWSTDHPETGPGVSGPEYVLGWGVVPPGEEPDPRLLVGTSAATGLTTATVVFAVLQQLSQYGIQLSPDEVYALITDTATHLPNGGGPLRQGAGMVDAVSAIRGHVMFFPLVQKGGVTISMPVNFQWSDPPIPRSHFPTGSPLQ